ncbi:HAD family hydrolase [Rhizobium sp. MHM7A]|uniref:HAD family hydrolase n=1 Tax=Rhizobium sp. MHM7A TaxID=2583233 RepID=UPI001106058A|nr:HAD family hydrolase [Rhizobium sp. MHM7A]TLX15869.1 HAD family hydrolase [Rhizobium sp. MHM7A]
MPHHSVKAIILDAFGTVIQPVPRNGPYHSVLSGASDFRAARNLALTLNDNLPALAEALGLPTVGDDIMGALDAEVANLSPFEDTQPFLRHIKSEGYLVAICSNLGHAYGARTRELLPEVDHFTFSFETGYFKPDQRIYQHTCDGLKISPDHAIFIGDTPLADGTGPREFGMNSEIIRRNDGDTLFSALGRALERVVCVR